MRPLPIIRVVSLLLLLGSAGCGEAADTATESDTGSDAESSTAPSGTRSDAPFEPITSRGVAAVVRDALGSERISAFSATGEDDTVGVEVQIGRGRDVLIVMVQTKGEPPPFAECDDLAGTGSSDDSCTVAEDGSILVSGTGEAFSDGNKRGSTVRAMSVNSETGRAVYALHETYAAAPALDATTLANIVSDPALAVMTDPSTNEAGADIALKRAGG